MDVILIPGFWLDASSWSEVSPVLVEAGHTVVAVGTALAGGPPRRSQRAELPHWAPTSGAGGKALAGPGMHDPGRR